MTTHSRYVYCLSELLVPIKMKDSLGTCEKLGRFKKLLLKICKSKKMERELSLVMRRFAIAA